MSEEREKILNQIEEELGEDGRCVVQILYDSDIVLSVEEIEEKLQEADKSFDVKQIRQILYSLSDKGYARSRRHRDDETGWISFLWNLFPDKIVDS